MSYQFQTIEQKWQKFWADKKTFKTTENKSKPKYYVLDMFPYPSGAGLHVGHPLGYIASDIFARYKRLQGFNVLHPMGYDAFGLPAEQYAIQTGQHPAITTDKNIKTYREQLDKIGFSYDWDREFRTCDPSYYKWTQWAFIKMFESYYDTKKDKACSINELIAHLEQNGTNGLNAHQSNELVFTASEWKSYSSEKREEVLQNYRLAYLADTPVNWCPALGTVLANDEVKDGLSVRGGHPVEQRIMKQWNLRLSAYAQRLLDGLEKIDWTESLKEIQRNWIGRSVGAEIMFQIKGHNQGFEIFTTRPDTIFGVTFMVLAPESEWVMKVTTKEQMSAVENYLDECKKKTQRERLADVKKISGVFTGAYCIHPFSGKEIPIWVGDYVLGGYGTGAIMAVPAHDSRDYAFAKHFKLPIIEVVSGGNIEEESYDAKEGKLVNSDFLNGLEVQEAIAKAIKEIESKKLGTKKINYRLRDAIFSRQRYWGEPFPVYYKNGLPHMIKESELPLELPEVDTYLPTESGEPPLGRAKNWQTKEGHPYELSTMPGFAGSSAYFLRFMDPHNNNELVSKEAVNYWQDVDLYLGGSEHATGHLIYARFWNKFLFDIGHAIKDEPFKKLINQGMIQGRSNFVYRLKSDVNKFVSVGLKDKYETQELHVDVNIVENDVLDIDAFRKWRTEFSKAEFITEEVDGKQVYKCGWAVEKMSKSMYNVVNPDLVVEKYGADTLRLYEMFLGPLEQSKPWNTQGIEGVSRFLNKLWRMFHNDQEAFDVSKEPATKEEKKLLHAAIKKVTEDINNFSFNTSVSAFMILVNELSKLKCNKIEILEPLVIILSPFAPHVCEELWQMLGHKESISFASWPVHDESLLVESTYNYPISFNGKTRFFIEIPLDANQEMVEKLLHEHAETEKYLRGKPIKKLIFVPKRIVNVVC
ncbi:MAG: leucine--tRNA ligase [Bacteriovoracaceae bacterium]